MINIVLELISTPFKVFEHQSNCDSIANLVLDTTSVACLELQAFL